MIFYYPELLTSGYGESLSNTVPILLEGGQTLNVDYQGDERSEEPLSFLLKRTPRISKHFKLRKRKEEVYLRFVTKMSPRGMSQESRILR